MDKKELEIVEEMQLVVEQMRLDDIEENPNIVEDFFECDCCSKHKCLAGSVQYKQYRLCNDCVLLAETGFALNRIKEIEDLMEDGNPERYAQVLTSCRRLWSETAKQLFEEVLPNYIEKTFKTKLGKDIDISGDHLNNKLSAVIETLQSKAAKNTLVGSETIYLIDWMEQINNRQSAGVQSEVPSE